MRVYERVPGCTRALYDGIAVFLKKFVKETRRLKMEIKRTEKSALLLNKNNYLKGSLEISQVSFCVTIPLLRDARNSYANRLLDIRAAVFISAELLFLAPGSACPRAGIHFAGGRFLWAMAEIRAVIAGAAMDSAG